MKLIILFQRLHMITCHSNGRSRKINTPLHFIIILAALACTVGTYIPAKASIATVEEVIVNIVPSRTVIEEHEELPVYIYITNNTNSPITIDKIKPLIDSNSDVPLNIQISPLATFEIVVAIKDLPAQTSSIAFASYYRSDMHPGNRIIIESADITVNYRFNFPWLPYTLSSLIGAVIGMLGTGFTRSFEQKKQILQNNFENKKRAVNKAISFYTWVGKAVSTSTSIPTLFWEKIFMEGDALLHLQELSETEPNQINLSDIATDTVSLLLLINQLNDRIKDDDSRSTFTLNLIKNIDELALDLRERVDKLVN